jgi:DNA-binding response OmpR family regulator
MARSSTLLALVRPSDHRRAALRAEAEAAACEIRFADTLQAAVLGLAARHPAAVIVDLECPECETLCQSVRSKRREVDIAVFGVTDRLTDQAFDTALRLGADDVVAFHAEGALSARVVSLPGNPSVPPPLRGDALVAVTDRTHAPQIGRVLTNAGYEVEFASDLASLSEVTRLKRTRLAVADGSLGDPCRIIQQARNAGSRATWVLVAPPAEAAHLEDQVRGLERVAVVSATDPPENILFVSNEVAAARRREFRIEPRLLHGTLVAFRGAGGESDDYGFTYNISPGGIYVRTLAPPLEPLVWLETSPPGTQRRVRLEGEVAWRRAFGRLGAATAPPGFGVRVTGGLSGDREAWTRGCSLLLECQRAGLVLESATDLPPPVPARPTVEESAPAVPASPVLEAPVLASERGAHRTGTRWIEAGLLVALVGAGWVSYQRCSSPSPPTDSPPRVMPRDSPFGAPVVPPGPSVAAASVGSAPASSAPPPVTSAFLPGDPAQLLSSEGYLWVTSGADRWVFVHGVKTGHTNSWLSVPCGLRHVRLGERPGEWASEGATVHVVCRGTTQVTIEPGR